MKQFCFVSRLMSKVGTSNVKSTNKARLREISSCQSEKEKLSAEQQMFAKIAKFEDKRRREDGKRGIAVKVFRLKHHVWWCFCSVTTPRLIMLWPMYMLQVTVVILFLLLFVLTFLISPSSCFCIRVNPVMETKVMVAWRVRWERQKR